MALGPWLLAAAVLLRAAGPAFAAQVCWTDRGAGQIKRMNMDGSDLRALTLSGSVTQAGANLRGIALDAGERRIVWADNASDRLLSSSWDGSASVVLLAIEGGNSFPADVRFDAASGNVYWCDQQRRSIHRFSESDEAAVELIPQAAATGPYFLDLDRRSEKIYWGDFEGGALFRANLDGTGRELLLTGNNRTRGVCVDSGGGMLYWINRDAGKIHRAPLRVFSGGPVPITITHPEVRTIYEGLDTPHGLVLDAPARKLYWADTGTNAGEGLGGNAVNRGDMDGGTPVEILAVGAEPWDLDLDRRCQNYAEWTARCFRRDASSAVMDPGADPDGDGMVNAVEYAFDAAPMHPDRAAMPQVVLVSEGNEKFAEVSVRRRRETVDLAYRIEVSRDGIHWTELEIRDGESMGSWKITVVSMEDGMESVTARTAIAPGDLERGFVRVRVVFAPARNGAGSNQPRRRSNGMAARAAISRGSATTRAFGPRKR